MGKTSIEWADFTHNFWVGCEKVSPGCQNCYAESWAKRSGHPELWQGARRRTTLENWLQPYKWNDRARPGARPRVFTNSLADFFDNQVPFEWRADAWSIIYETPNLDWLLLTKRPQNIENMLPLNWETGWPNVWIGTTAENQEEADRRLPHLIKVPAVVRFVSVEPMLGPVDLRRWLYGDLQTGRPLGKISWTIIGGESGPFARPMNHDWAHALLSQCLEASSPVFMKQMGGKRKPFPEIPAGLMVREFPRTTI